MKTNLVKAINRKNKIYLRYDDRQKVFKKELSENNRLDDIETH